ncbi:MAG: FAD:protein FMN transferase [Pseudomonadota bacterium]
MKRRTLIAASLGAFGLAAGAGLLARRDMDTGQRIHSGAALAFGTSISVSVVCAEQGRAEKAIAAALHAAQGVDRLMSIYHPDSQVFRLNRDGVLARPDALLLAVLEQAQALSQLTSGAFDVTVQPLWQAFSAAAAHRALPPERERVAAQTRVGWRDLVFDTDTVRFLRPGMALTLNGLAQGYAADLALAALREHGIASALLDTGEFTARGGKPQHRPWMLGVRDPRDAAALAAVLRLDGRAMATSGDYETAFTEDLIHHHIFDPALGDSPVELASVTVLAPDAMLADGLSTACMVLGAARSHALAARMAGVDLMTIDKHGAVRRSPGFAAAAKELT